MRQNLRPAIDECQLQCLWVVFKCLHGGFPYMAMRNSHTSCHMLEWLIMLREVAKALNEAPIEEEKEC